MFRLHVSIMQLRTICLIRGGKMDDFGIWMIIDGLKQFIKSINIH